MVFIEKRIFRANPIHPTFQNDSVELVKKSYCGQRQRAAFLKYVESISRKAQKQGQSRLRSCLASLGTTFGRAQKSLFLGGRLVFHRLLCNVYSPGYGTLSLCRPFSVIASGAEGGAWQPLRMVALHVQEIAASLAPLLPRDDVEGHR